MKFKKPNPDMMAQDGKLARRDRVNDPVNLMRPMPMAVQGASMAVRDQSTRVVRDMPQGVARSGAASQ